MNLATAEWVEDNAGDALHSVLFQQGKAKVQRNVLPEPKGCNMKQLPKTCVRKGHVAGGKIKKEKIVIKNVKKNKLKKIEKKQVLLKVGNGKMKKLNKTGETTMKQKKLPKQVTGSSSEKNLEMEIVPRKKKKQKVEWESGLKMSALRRQLDAVRRGEQGSAQNARGGHGLRERMQERLNAARFRYLNQSLYEGGGQGRSALRQADTHAAYHDGYRAQAARWPMQPLERVIRVVRALPGDHVVADLGCGDALLARSVPQRVHSFDLAESALPEAAGLVTACDMAHVPLPDGSVHAAVFCLSLMGGGRELRNYMLEANRILRRAGILFVAEVESRFDGEHGMHRFLKQMRSYGFRNTRLDLSNNLFYFLDFSKERDICDKSSLPSLKLKPCLYKKR